MRCPVCKGQMTPSFYSMVCQNNCNPRQVAVAEALYKAALDAAQVAGIWTDPWDDLEEEAKQVFYKLAQAAIDVIEP